ncbi:pha synthase subunit protein [Dyella jejuensis]|uniref:Poly(3-hydroxyalkanoate) polymerase subunit PhaE n=1 Tax=Dyella jejuensis TaxID=1432009 RepID=A0ABW8JDM0_9GAMM
MPDQTNDFLKDYQAFAQQSWDAWMRYMQQPAGSHNPFVAQPVAAPTDDLLTRSLASLKAYGSWLQQAAGAGVGHGQFGHMGVGNWQQPASLQSFLAAFNQPFAQALTGLDSASAFGLDHQWQSWVQAMQRAGMGMPGHMAALGITREQQLDQQALLAAINEYMQIHARYQALLQQVNKQGIARLQDSLAEHAQPGKQLDSMKALYDLWVDAMEDAYSEMALTDEFRDVFGELVNAQMQVRKLQQQQTEQLCRELGIPTRSEVDSLGQRVQQLRRELKSHGQHHSQADAPMVDALKAEIAALKRALADSKSTATLQPVERKPAGRNGKATTSSPPTKTTRSAAGKRK